MSITTDELKHSIKGFISSSSFSDVSKLQDDTLIFREGFFDSMGFMSLITFLENNFKINIADNDLIEENFESINAIVKFTEEKRVL